MVRNQNLPLLGPLIKEKAIAYAEMSGIEDFQASSGWLGKFKKHHGITEKSIACDQSKPKLKLILKDY